jgi:hypothetical protein
MLSALFYVGVLGQDFFCCEFTAAVMAAFLSD